MTKTQLLTFVSLLALILSTGCGGVTVTDEDGDTVTVVGGGGSLSIKSGDGNAAITNEGGTITINTNDGEGGSAHIEAGAGAEFPDDFPSNVPVYEGAEVVMAISGSQSDSSTQMVTLTTSDPVADVIDFYDEGLAENGWTIDNRIETQQGGNQGVMFIASQENQRCNVNVAGGGSGDEVTIVLTYEESQE